MRQNFQQMQASFLSFAFKCQCKVPPSGIRDTRGQIVVLSHVSDLQVFDDDGIVFGVEPMSRLKVEVSTLIDNMLVLFGQTGLHFCTPLAANIAFEELLLRAFELVFRLSEVTRILT